MASYPHASSPRRFAQLFGLGAAIAVTVASGAASAQEPVECLSADPAVWPAPSKPYFMILVDTSGSMISSVAGAAPSCTGYASTRMGHARCAVKNTVLAFSEVNYGLAQFASFMTGCGMACYGNDSNVPQPGCDIQCYNAELALGQGCRGCGPYDNFADKTTARGGRVLVGMQVDNHWSSPPNPTNLPQILQYVDNNCTNNQEVVNVPTDGPAYGLTPLNGSLRDMRRYFQTGWTNPDNPAETFPTPLNANDRACRSVNVILLTDGDETCDSQAQAVSAATALFTSGVTVGGKTFNIRTHVINFAGGNQANTDAIAAAGGTGASYFATNEVQLSTALANIIAGAIKPETCDNTDNNCNGCTDEGFQHYCDVQVAPTAGKCCSLARATCLSNYTASITQADPDGDLTLLPCTTAIQQTQPLNWLCFDPKETCDNIDNNCQAGVDEGVLKCGNPLHCPNPEICNAEDDDCDGLTNEGNVCPNACVPSPEVCDGCDNDCDGFTDDGIAAIPCGPAAPPNCAGTLSCKPPVAVPPGGCVVGGGFNSCVSNPMTEVCDGVDNDCDGSPDDNIPPVVCGAVPGLNYGPNSQCQTGTQLCGGPCIGVVGPSMEVCDGIDNDCDGVVDDNVPGVNQPCGINQAPCTPGATACINGALVCQGGNGPQPEVCDGADNDCDGLADEAPLADAPAPNQNGCWTIAGNCCTFQNLTWCPPPDATCFDVGTLTPPCNKGALACSGAGGWVCQNPKGPVVEACDGIDNNCDGLVDNGNFPQVGQVCGSDVGECSPGVIACTAGVLDCVGDVPPTPEQCNGLDDDCDTVIDNGIVVGVPCIPPYDMVAYPGPRDNLPCQPGLLQCDGNGGNICVGGVGPMPEICDGIDNDCDGDVDEVGAAPDGIDGSQNPFPPPDAVIGDACGVDTGECQQGAYACVNGSFACLGGQSSVPEVCDCNDNDCNGAIDNENPNGPALCSANKDCVKSGDSCQCAAPCAGGENPCPPGQKCEQVVSSETGQTLGNYCVIDLDALCGDCTTKTVTDANMAVQCAPAGTILPNCVEPPVCKCAGQNGCQEPCFGVTCGPGEVCKNFGANAGTCGVDNCFNAPCQGCGKICKGDGTCDDNPCTDTSCPDPGTVCKPDPTFTTFTCVPTCAGVMCAADETCHDGTCAKCDPACAPGQVCDLSQSPPACVDNACEPNTCSIDGQCCDPVTGCGSCPCEGVICPTGEVCMNNECVTDQGGTGGNGSGGGATTTGTGTGGTTAVSTGSGAGGAAPQDDSIWGLATGGGGCACDATGASRPGDLRWGLLALAVAALRRRRGRSPDPRSKAKQARGGAGGAQ
jgi:MYXO-CTERM domain-containing protein